MDFTLLVYQIDTITSGKISFDMMLWLLHNDISLIVYTLHHKALIESMNAEYKKEYKCDENAVGGHAMWTMRLTATSPIIKYDNDDYLDGYKCYKLYTYRQDIEGSDMYDYIYTISGKK